VRAANRAGLQYHRRARHGDLHRRPGRLGAIEVLRALAGLTADATGEIRAMGAPMQLRSAPQAQAAKIQFISEDRAGEGVPAPERGSEPGRNQLPEHPLRPARTPGLRATANGSPRGRHGLTRLRSPADELSGETSRLAFGRSAGRYPRALMNELTRGVMSARAPKSTG
jgi:hypothetical protein